MHWLIFYRLFRHLRCLHYSSWSKRTSSLTSLKNIFNNMIHERDQVTVVVSPRPGATLKLHDHIIQDDFSWLQDQSSSEVQQIIKDENRFTEIFLKDTKSFQNILVKRISHLSEQVQHVDLSGLSVEIGNYLYYTKECRNYPGLVVHCRRHSDHEQVEEEIFDESSVIGHWKHIAVKSMKISPSGKLVAFIVDISGKDTYRGIVIDMTKNPGEICEELPSVNLEWAGNEQLIYYTTFDHLKRANKVWKHNVGSNLRTDKLIFEEKDVRFFVDISFTKDRHFITINCNSKSTSEVHVLSTADSDCAPQLIRPRETGIEYYVEHYNGTFFILTNVPAGKNYQVMVTDAKNLDSKSWRTLVPSNEKVILDDMDVFSGYCVLYKKENTLPRLTVLPLKEKSSEYTIQLPDSTCVINPGYNLDFNCSVVNFTTSSPIQPPTAMEINLETKQLRNLHENEAKGANVDFSKYCRSQIEATSKDGTQVPITIFHKKGIQLNGEHPILIHVYGTYGMNVNMDFSPEKFYLLSQGWTLAFCHVRGGGELGRDWYHMGRMLNKRNSFEDFEACIRTLQDKRYSSPHLTAIKATSAGGLPVAVLCNNAPELVKAVVLKVPLVDVMSAMLDQELELTAQEFEEFGNPRLDVDAFNNLTSFCPYLNLSNQDYPNMLLMSSLNDIRVPYWMPLKFVKKCRYIKSISDPSYHNNMLLLKTDFESGHFGAGTFQETAFIYAFLYKALGLPFE